MFAYVWPIALVVISNIVYQVCAKAVPEGMDPIASLTITYFVSALACGILYFALNRDASLVREYSKINWAVIVLGAVLVGLEIGFLYAYQAGWEVSKVYIVQSTLVSVALIFLGFFGYHEALTWNKILGAVVCLAGIVLINYK